MPHRGTSNATTHPKPGGLARLLRIGAALWVDDVAILAWLAVVQPLTLGSHAHAISDFGDQSALWGWAYLVAAGGAIICLGSRSVDEPTLAWTSGSTPHSVAPLPFVIAVALLASFGLQDVGAVPAEVVFLPALCLALAAFLFYPQLPTLRAPARRVAVLPIQLVSSAVFNGLMFEVFSEIDKRTLVQAGVGLPVFLLLASGMFYAFFIFAPSQIADTRGSWPEWAVRYGLFVVASVVGVSVIGAVWG